ncbi:amidase family protein [Paenibacillus sp. TRM 82003]|nr:amidase family protein [Paenibacillus sp. TRM 82003]
MSDHDEPGGIVKEASIVELQEGLKAKRFSSFELVLAYLDRIAAYDKDGPRINAMLEINPDAYAIAEAMDRERAISGPRGPLHGIPIVLKDNIETGDRMATSGGALALRGNYAAEDAFVVRKLREAGAILLGKANMSEMAKFVSTRMPNAYSSRGGFVRNPYGPGELEVGGSSCGSGAAAAASFAAAAFGTETFGSIINPAVENSLVGLNPSVGLVSRSGIMPLAPTHDTAGPMTRTVADAAILMGVLSGIDPKDPSTLMSRERVPNDYSAGLTPDALRGARIGIPKHASYPNLHDEEIVLIEREIETLRSLGAVLVEADLTALEEEKWDITVLVYEFKGAINHYLSKLPPHLPAHCLTELIEFNRTHNPGVALYGQDLLLEADRTSGTLTEPEYLLKKARDLRSFRSRGIDAAIADHRLDAILSPGHTGVAAPAKAGYPSITVPAGYKRNGSAFGLTFTGTAFSEPKLLALGFAYEQATLRRKPPDLLTIRS